ncbi:DNA-directed RNA polymerase I subunit rpa49 [Coemansia biformis]|uniref:DNA-directed RNA polymerase I subunit rpa49 n=1 Tax=Coemansia biformis TaxID=1286918 RepID=A0A9W7Y6W8_9FUNG|nr:DNA-directed RNA polymerase I subunit rpa49 [Coemansia biformis]
MGSKRKASEHGSVSISIDSTKAKVQPVLATFAAGIPPAASAFATYRCTDKSKGDRYIVASETDKVEYVGQSFEGERLVAGGCKYLVGVYDKATDTVTFRAAPVVRVGTAIKSLKGVRGAADRDISGQLLQARNELGEAFGNKKRKAQIRAEERNRIDMGAVQGDKNIIQASIELRTNSMPTAQDLRAAEDTDRPVPKYDPQATAACDIYDMEDVLPKAVAAHIDVAPFVKAADAEEYRGLIPVRSQFVAKKIEGILAQPKPDVGALRRVLYLGYLMRLAALSRSALQRRDTCLEALCCAPEVADAMFDRFAECVAGSLNPDGSPVYIKTPATETRLVCYIAVLMLSINNWVVYPAELSADLGIPSKKAEKYLASVGCKIEAAHASEMAMNVMSRRARPGPGRKAILKAPVKFPKAPQRGA